VFPTAGLTRFYPRYLYPGLVRTLLYQRKQFVEREWSDPRMDDTAKSQVCLGLPDSAIHPDRLSFQASGVSTRGQRDSAGRVRLRSLLSGRLVLWWFVPLLMDQCQSTVV
jgi:hypothetical protein